MTEQIETERKSILEGEYIQAGSSERVFSTLAGLADYIRTFNIESARFSVGNLEGKKCYVLQYKPMNQ